ncbi:hypothetical protein SAMD00019534_077480, partial [Acytostelium subglobosum LB1]|uniref:hypothetical protein n=1 Tax=Acytostelium subglobosum LB1 TaxID=1410327 RepID=UPI000644ACE8
VTNETPCERLAVALDTPVVILVAVRFDEVGESEADPGYNLVVLQDLDWTIWTGVILEDLTQFSHIDGIVDVPSPGPIGVVESDLLGLRVSLDEVELQACHIEVIGLGPEVDHHREVVGRSGEHWVS